MLSRTTCRLSHSYLSVSLHVMMLPMIKWEDIFTLILMAWQHVFPCLSTQHAVGGAN